VNTFSVVKTGITASTELAGLNLTAGLWHANYGTPQNGSGRELDLFASASKDLGLVTATIGYIYYSYPNAQAGNTQEVYVTLAKSLFGLDFALSHYGDIEGDNDGYTEGSIGKSIEIASGLVLKGSGHLGYLAEEHQASHLGTTIALDYALSKCATLTPYISASYALSDGDASVPLYTSSEDEVIGGVKLSLNF
jgi:Bacterial protein of unknown function (Gcw_chp)